MPRLAYSIANDLVAASSPPLVSEARTEGTFEFAWVIRLVVMLTTWPPPCSSICATERCVMAKNPVRLNRDDVGVVLGGVIGERLGDEDASVVDQRVDPARTQTSPG